MDVVDIVSFFKLCCKSLSLTGSFKQIHALKSCGSNTGVACVHNPMLCLPDISTWTFSSSSSLIRKAYPFS